MEENEIWRLDINPCVDKNHPLGCIRLGGFKSKTNFLGDHTKYNLNKETQNSLMHDFMNQIQNVCQARDVEFGGKM